jgi:hypothetical protein
MIVIKGKAKENIRTSNVWFFTVKTYKIRVYIINEACFHNRLEWCKYRSYLKIVRIVYVVVTDFKKLVVFGALLS